MNAPDTLEILRNAFPISAGLASLELVPSEPATQAEPELDSDEDEDSEDEDEDEDGEGERLTVRLIVWEERDGQRQIRDVKEQQVWVGGTSELDATRLAVAVAGWRIALEQLFSQSDSSWLDALMPSDLTVSFPELVALKRPRTAEDFAEALLTSKQRLGRWVRE